MSARLIRRLLAVLAVAPCAGLGAQGLPARVEIGGVPFVSWREAAGWNYQHREVMNPSLPAAWRMVTGYWYPELTDPAALDSAQGVLLARAAEAGGTSATMADLKARLAQGKPVLVSTALTPVAHPLYFAFEMELRLGMVKAKIREGPRSGALGRMLPLDQVDAFRKTANPVLESMTASSRVLVGYDDDRGVVLVHDPTFGPAMEIPYADFEQMWAAADHRLVLMEPADAAGRVALRVPAPPYRPRTPDELAAQRFVYGYGHSAIGQLDQGEAQLRNGLALTGVSNGYRHLLYFQLALVLGDRRRIDQAVAMADSAALLVPDDPGPWSFIAMAATQSGSKAVRDRARPAERRANALEKDDAARQRLDAAIPADFWVMSLARTRGWGVPVQPLTS
jgi:hypothetical protein